MIDERITPEEFARVMGLSESHPERRRAEANPQFAALRALHDSFVAGDEAGAAGAESIRAELERRVLPRVLGPAGAGATAGGGPSGRSADRTGGFFAALLAAFAQPAARWSVAFAAIALVAGVGWWSTARGPRRDVIRGEATTGAFEVRAALRGGSLELRWTAVPEADGYRVVLLGADLTEVAHFDLGNGTTKTLDRDSLPPALASGQPVSVEIVALKSGQPIATTPARAIRQP